MSTGINIAPSSDITVGTTAVTSGTDTRVFFQAGGVVQQDANFTFDNTLKRLTLKAVGTAATDIPFAVQNSGGALNLLEFPGTGNLITRHNSSGSSLGLFHRADTTGFSLTTGTSGYATGSGYEQVGATSYLLAASERMFSFSRSTWNSAVIPWYFSNVGDNSGDQGLWIGRGSDPASITIRFNRNVGIGTTAPSARLDVKAQGALSTDIAFRVRNSADTSNIVNFNGNGQFAIGLGASVNSTAVPEYSVVIGHNASDGAAGNRTASVAIGRLASGNYYGVAIGTQSTSSGDAGVAIGASATAGVNGSALGYQATAAGAGVSIGKLATSTSQGAITIGTNTINNQNYSIVFNSSLQVITNEHSNVCKMYFNSTKQSFFYHENGRFVINSKVDLVANTNYDNTATNTVTITNGTTPTLNIVDSFQQYAADITAGNAAPHFRTENGAIVKVYQETTAVTAATLVSGLGTPLTDTDTFDGYTLKQIVKALRNQGLLA